MQCGNLEWFAKIPVARELRGCFGKTTVSETSVLGLRPRLGRVKTGGGLALGVSWGRFGSSEKGFVVTVGRGAGRG